MPQIGDKLSQYTILSAVGSGGMGTVFLAEDSKLGRRTALKFLSAKFASDREHRERFLREARAASALNHPNICTIYEINDTADPPFIAMEYVEGETLAAILRRRRRSLRQAMSLTLQIADALAEAHSKGVVHRDIKPANIVISKNDRVKILDFGLAKLTFADEDGPEALFRTSAGVVLGTASYMSPEQARGQDIDHRSDLWSLGVCMYEMLTGTLPFKGNTAADTFAALLTAEPKAPSAIVDDVPPEVDKVVLRLISRPRDDRYESAEHLYGELKRLERALNIDRDPDIDGQSPAGTDEPTEVFENAPTEHNVRSAGSAVVPNNLTSTFASIIGREQQIASVSELLLSPEVRLLTMTGIGGTGKTTLSRAVARRLLSAFEHGVYFVEMADVTRPDVVASTIAQPLKVREEGGRPILELLKDYLSGRQMLIVIDNFEQVVEAAPQIAELLNASHGLKILVTSRELLRLTPEVEYQVPPLKLPDAGSLSFEELKVNEAIMLFAERARTARPAFVITPDNAADVAAICSRLDGLPLAIELAAARVKVLSPASILSKLDNRLDLLTGGSRDLPERQKTMRGAVMWSYDLLSTQEKAVFRELAVFSGGFRMDAAEFVCQQEGGQSRPDLIDIIASLLDKSLLAQKETRDGERRFRMLDVVRDFAAEMLSAEGSAEFAHRRHAQFYVELGATAEPLLQTAASGIWLERLQEEHDNIRAAMDWALAREPEMAVRLAVSVRNYWLVHSHLGEGFGWLKAASESGFEPPPGLKFKLLNGLGLAARFRGDFATARRAYEAGLAAGTEAGDRPGIALSNRGLGLVNMQLGDLEAAKEHFDAGLEISRDLDDTYGIAMSLSFLGDLARTEGRYADARPQFEEAVALFRKMDNRTATSDSLNNLGAAKVCLGLINEASGHFQEALCNARDLSNRITISCSLDGLAAVAAESGFPLRAAVLSGAADGIREHIDYKIEPAESRFREFYLSRLSGLLTTKELELAVSEGRITPLDAAVQIALEPSYVCRPDAADSI